MRRFFRSMTATAALSTLLFACGKDEPATPPPQPQPAAQVDPAKGGDDKTKDEAKLGGGENKPNPVGAAPAEPPPVVPLPPLVASAAPVARAALTPSSIATFPADIVAVGGTPSLAALVNAFAAQAARVPGQQIPPDPLPMAIGAFQAQTGIDLSWLDTDKPLRFAVPDPKKFQNGFMLLLPEKAGAFDPAKVPNGTPGNGHLLTIKVSDERSIYLDRVVDGHILASSHADLAKSMEAFVKDLGAWTPKDPLVLDTSVENLVRIFADEVKSAKEMVGMVAGAAGDDGGGQMAQMVKLASGGFALVEGAQRMSISLDPAGDFPRIGFAFRGLPGSPLDKAAKDLSGRKIAFAGAVPADAWLAFGFDIEGASYLSDAQAVVDAVTKPGGLGPMPVTWTDDEKKAMHDLIIKAQELSGSQNMAWIRQEGPRPFIFESLTDAKDGKALQGALMELGEFFYKKVWAEGRKAMLAQGGSAADMPESIAFKDFVGLASKNLSALGFGLSVNEASTKAGNQVGALEFKIDWSRLPMKGPAQAVSQAFGGNIGISLAGEAQRFATVIGPDAATRATRILDEAAAPTEQKDPWLAMANDHVMFAMLRPARLLRALVDLVPDLASKREAIGQMPDDPFVVRGTSDGSQLYLEGTIPAKVLLSLGNMR